MRIALNGLFLAYPATGTGQYLREIVGAMRAVSPHDEFLFVSPHSDPSAPASLEVRSTRIKRENFAKLEFEQITFPNVCKTLNATLAHTPHFGPPLFPPHPSVVTIHDLIPLVVPAYGGLARVRLYTRLAALGAQRADAILADSYASARDIGAHLRIPRAKIHVVHLAANPRFQPPSADEIARVRAKYLLPEQFVLYLGGFDVRKNVAGVVEAFGKAEIGVSPNKGLWRLVLAGKLPDSATDFFPSPQKMVERFGVAEQTQFIGFVAEEDKPALYAAARVFLYPSMYEGFGLPPLEAMACGTPVLVSNTSSLPEVVGDGGILLAPDDAGGWADALRMLVTDGAKWNELRDRGLAQAKLFSWDRAAQETLDVYRSLV